MSFNNLPSIKPLIDTNSSYINEKYFLEKHNLNENKIVLLDKYSHDLFEDCSDNYIKLLKDKDNYYMRKILFYFILPLCFLIVFLYIPYINNIFHISYYIKNHSYFPIILIPLILYPYFFSIPFNYIIFRFFSYKFSIFNNFYKFYNTDKLFNKSAPFKLEKDCKDSNLNGVLLSFLSLSLNAQCREFSYYNSYHLISSYRESIRFLNNSIILKLYKILSDYDLIKLYEHDKKFHITWKYAHIILNDDFVLDVPDNCQNFPVNNLVRSLKESLNDKVIFKKEYSNDMFNSSYNIVFNIGNEEFPNYFYEIKNAHIYYELYDNKNVFSLLCENKWVHMLCLMDVISIKKSSNSYIITKGERYEWYFNHI